MDKRIVYVFFALILIINIIGIIILPNELVMQINSEGNPNWSLNKYIAIPLLLLLSFFGGRSTMTSESNKGRGYMLLIILLFVNIMMFIFNL